ncbi:MAG TPA: hypothetical protein VGP35_07535 [Terriglobales bacterium]|nr:hypothetical protein [Terriglobales bacterium]
MAPYLLSYDISEKNHDYQSLYDFLEANKAKRILYSEWAVPWANDSSALKLADAATEHIEKGDSLLVCELFDNTPTSAWLKLRISTDDFTAMITKYARTDC